MTISQQTWLWLDSSKGEAAANMAIDELLLKSMPELRRPVLRFYSWTQPAASFGYFQRYADVEALTPLRPLVRRPTGGGIVPHDCDWTYSAAFPAGHAWYELRAVASYRKVHEWIRLAFHELGVETELAPTARKTLPGQCFQGHEQHDLLFKSRKIAGAAQRRTREGLLIQGSVQSPLAGLSRQRWQSAMLSAMEAQGIAWEVLDWTQLLEAKAVKLAEQKFGSERFLMQR